jgi:acyl-CoA synthetase (AMP-forming)/AMP-acid ligase II
MLAERDHSARPRPFRAFRRLRNEPDLGADRQLVERAAGDAVAVEINLVVSGGDDESAIPIGQQVAAGGDGGGRSLRLVANGSEPVSAPTLRRFLDRFGPYGFHPEAMAPAYGLAENTVGLTLPGRGSAPVIDRISRHALSKQGVADPVSGEADGRQCEGLCGQLLLGLSVIRRGAGS